jgi:hypothetical protein
MGQFGDIGIPWNVSISFEIKADWLFCRRFIRSGKRGVTRLVYLAERVGGRRAEIIKAFPLLVTHPTHLHLIWIIPIVAMCSVLTCNDASYIIACLWDTDVTYSSQVTWDGEIGNLNLCFLVSKMKTKVPLWKGCCEFKWDKV